jgi:MATE family multidrug resistance protein
VIVDTRSALAHLPALSLDDQGQRRVDYRAVIALAAPLAANSAVQAVLGLTDTWFVGHLGIAATAAMGATFFLVLFVLLAFGGAGIAVQTFVAQAYGARRMTRAASATWTGMWAALILAPLFWLAAVSGRALIAPFGLQPDVAELAAEFWLPRLMGGPFAVALWTISGFFNGIGRTRVTLEIALAVAVINVALNAWFVFGLHWGIAGSAWATTCSQGIAVVLGLAAFLRRRVDARFKSRRTWRFSWPRLRRLFDLGLSTGLFAAVDLFGFALFQLMQVRLGPLDGAATQIVMMLTSAAYLPGLGVALAATTLVGQAIGAGDREWAARIGNAAIRVGMIYMGVVGVLLALGGPWLVAQFMDAGEVHAAGVARLGGTLLWIAAGYQMFDALNMGASFCLRGAGDVKAPTVMLLALSWGGFVPLVHMLSFAPGEGFTAWGPHLGWGAVGGWIAALAYISILSLILFWRWHSGAWRRIRLTLHGR